VINDVETTTEGIGGPQGMLILITSRIVPRLWLTRKNLSRKPRRNPRALYLVGTDGPLQKGAEEVARRPGVRGPWALRAFGAHLKSRDSDEVVRRYPGPMKEGAANDIFPPHCGRNKPILLP